MRAGAIGLVLAVVAIVPSSIAIGQSGERYVAVAAHIDNVQNPTDIFQFANDCASNTDCAKALRAISSATGWPIDKAVTSAAALSSSRDGEGSNTLVGLPEGYRYCSARFTLTSIVPRDGDRGSTLMLEARNENGRSGVAVETWTPVKPFGQGRSWVEGDLTVIGVREDLADVAYKTGTPCYRVAERRIFLACRGSGCEGEAIDKGRTVNPSGTGAGERRD